MAQADNETPEGWEFDLGENVQLVWTPSIGQVVGRTEYCHRDVQYLLEYVNGSGELVQQWVYGDCIDKLGAKH